MVAVAELLLAGVALLLFLYLLWRATRAFLWRVGRRLAVSYFLIGVLPIPMVALLVGLNAYLISGFFLGHLYRDALSYLENDLARTAQNRLSSEREQVVSNTSHSVSFARYRGGHRVTGDALLPLDWPAVLDGPEETAGPWGREPAQFFVLADGNPTLVAAAASGPERIIARYKGDLAAELTRRSGIWVSLVRSDDPRKKSKLRLELGGRVFALKPFVEGQSFDDRNRYFASGRESGSILDKPWLWWNEISGTLRSLEDGTVVADHVSASLNGTLRTVGSHLLSSSAELDAAAWAGLVGITGLLATIYAVAVAMALVMILTLSRAVNQLSRATETVRHGDFTARIPIRRKDQIGELHSSFNQMSENLEALIQTAAQKEILENELEIARNLQQSLLPTDLPSSESIDFATLFEPSAAIGGDYFDILRIDDTRLAVVVSDVSGHGLSTGLRMAMLKAALVILVEESKEPTEILRRLSSMIRADREGHFFATATVAVIDFRQGSVELTNAGHPPTYLLRRGNVEEILLPGNPLGALGESYGSTSFQLEAGDVLVWLSDGLIEAVDPTGEPFGYHRVQSVLAGTAASAADVRNRLVDGVKHHTAGQPPEDDMTLVAMLYRAPDLVESIPSAE
jgi:serine phosphatase RsbU (regulator of sigma subunit)